MDDLKRHIGEIIKHYRKSQNITTNELGVLSETSQSTISGIERGERFANLESMLKICDALGITLYDVLPPNPKDLLDNDPQVRQLLNTLKNLPDDQVGLILNLISDAMPLLALIHQLNPQQRKNLANHLDSLMNNH